MIIQSTTPVYFDKSVITWGLLSTKYPRNDLTLLETQNAIRSALNAWHSVLPFLSFLEVDPATQNPDITMGFYTREEMGFNTELARQTIINGNVYIVYNIHFSWTTFVSTRFPTSKVSVYDVTLHEFGHALGLDHTNDTSSIMYRTYGLVRRPITKDNVDMIKRIYAKQFFEWQNKHESNDDDAPHPHHRPRAGSDDSHTTVTPFVHSHDENKTCFSDISRCVHDGLIKLSLHDKQYTYKCVRIVK